MHCMPKRTKKQDIFVSVVVVATNTSQGLAEKLVAISDVLAVHYTNYETIIINNGASTEVASEIVELLDAYPCLRIAHLSRVSRYDTAVFAGLELAVGDYVCTVNPVTDPIEVITEMIAANRNEDVIQGVSDLPLRGVFGLRLGRRIFYWYNRKYIGVDIPIDGTYFASYSRAAVNALMASKRSHRHIRHLVRLVGYRPVNLNYVPLRNPIHQRTMRTGIIEALEIAANYSTHPLRFVTWLGFLAGIVNIVYALYVVVVNVTSDNIVAGWTTMSLQLSGMFFILFAIMVILAEYIGRILAESQHEPQYYIVDEQSSTVGIADKTRRNIEK